MSGRVDACAVYGCCVTPMAVRWWCTLVDDNRFFCKRVVAALLSEIFGYSCALYVGILDTSGRWELTNVRVDLARRSCRVSLGLMA